MCKTLHTTIRPRSTVRIILYASTSVVPTAGEVVLFVERAREVLSLGKQEVAAFVDKVLGDRTQDPAFLASFVRFMQEHPCAWREARVLADIRPYHAHRHSSRSLPLGECV